jgi:hypothetical protein
MLVFAKVEVGGQVGCQYCFSLTEVQPQLVHSHTRAYPLAVLKYTQLCALSEGILLRYRFAHRFRRIRSVLKLKASVQHGSL